jgi:4-amino-4-deoxy-L-arabinose transferase-like glycosyltransferase
MTPSAASKKRPASTLGSQQRWLVVAGVFLIAFLFRYVLVTRMPRPLVSDLFWNDETGWNLAQGHGFTAALSGYVPAIFRTPGYPAFIAVIYRIFGHSLHAALVGNALLDSLTAVLVLLIGWRLLGPVVGGIAGLLYALYPYPATYCGMLYQDILLTLAVTLTLYLTLRAQDQPDRLGRWLLVGFMIGATAMVKPFLALYGIVPALVVLIATQLASARKMVTVAVMVAASVLVISPWVARNYHYFHSFPPLAVGGAGGEMKFLFMEVTIGDEALLAGEAHAPTNREAYLAEFQDGQKLIDLERSQGQEYGSQLRRMWPRTLRVVVSHIPRLWVSRYAMGYAPVVASIALIIGLSVLIFGLIGMYAVRYQWRAWLAIYASVVVITLVYAPVGVEARYTLPARPAMILFVTAALVFVYERVAGRSGSVATNATGRETIGVSNSQLRVP